MKNKIAVIIPTVKPYDVSCKLAVDSIISSINRNPIADFDIFISGPQDPNDDRVKFIKEEKFLEAIETLMSFKIPTFNLFGSSDTEKEDEGIELQEYPVTAVPAVDPI